MNKIETRIAGHPFTKPLSEEALKVMAVNAHEQIFEPGQIILSSDQPANSLYLVEEGKVVVEAHEPGRPDRLVQTIGPGSGLGWSWLFAPFAWHLQARAVERTRAIRLDGGHVLAHCESNHKVGYEIMKQVSQTVISRLQAARQRLVETRSATK